MLRSLAAVHLLTLVVGCGGSGSISGVVTCKGKPIITGRVTAVVGDEGPRVGLIQSDGKYRIENVPVGLVKLAVESPDPLTQPSGGDGDNGNKKPTRPPGWIALPAKYADASKSGITMDVRSGNNSKDIPLD